MRHKIDDLCSNWSKEAKRSGLQQLYEKELKIKTSSFFEESDRSDEGLTLETSAFLPFTVANLRFQPSC